MDGGGWWATVHGIAELHTAEQLHFSLPIGPHSLTHLVKRTDVLEGRLLLNHESRPQIE